MLRRSCRTVWQRRPTSATRASICRIANLVPRISPIITSVPHHAVSFSSYTDNNDPSFRSNRRTSNNTIKPWNDPQVRIRDRVDALVAATRIHPADFFGRGILDLLQQCGKLGTLAGMQLAEDAMDRLVAGKRELQEDGRDVYIPIKVWDTHLFSYATLANRLPAARDALPTVLDRALVEARHDAVAFPNADHRASTPTTAFFNTYLRGLAHAASRRHVPSAERAEAGLGDMYGHAQHEGWPTKPNTVSFQNVLTAWVRTRDATAGERARGVLENLKTVHAQEKELYEEETGLVYDYALTKEERVRRIVTPDVRIYTTVMKAVMESGANFESVLELLEEAMASECVRSDPGLFVMAIQSLSSMIETERVATKRVEYAHLAEDILRSLIKYLDDQKSVADGADDDVDSDKTCAGLLSAYNACLDVWSRSFSREGAPQYERILMEMIEHKDKRLRPDRISFMCGYHAWARSFKFHQDSAEKAESLFTLQSEMVASGELTEAVKPDFQTYTVAILCFGESNDSDKILRATRLLQKLVEDIPLERAATTGNPTGPFTAALSTIARTRPSGAITNPDGAGSDFASEVDTSTDPYSIAAGIYTDIQNDTFGLGTKCDHHSISAMLRCVVTHCPVGSIERRNATKDLFEEACELGQVSRLVVEAYRDAVGDDIPLDGMPSMDANKRPKAWGENVPDKFLRLRR